jgi:hypothetical protein
MSNESSSSNKSSSSSRLTILDFICAGGNIQNCTNLRISADSTNIRRFHKSPAIASILWHHLDEHDLLPSKCIIYHLLWIFYFSKVYPKQGMACRFIGGSTRAVDPKTFNK